MDTYGDIYFKTRKILRDREIEQSDWEARLLCASACGKTVAEFLRDTRMYVTDGQYVETIKAMLRRRLTGEPLAYVTGSWQFYGLPMKITRDVLIPRIDTEVLADRVVQFLRQKDKPRVLELCAGSGCVGIAAAVNVPGAVVLLTDISHKALSVARSNVLLNGVSQTVRCMEMDALSTPDSRIGKFDLVVANPPYIRTGEIDGLDASVRDYEPRIALDGGTDGLDFYRAITDHLHLLLRPGGGLFFEVGIRQAMAVATLMQDKGVTNIGFTQDTGGIDRVVSGTYQTA